MTAVPERGSERLREAASPILGALIRLAREWPFTLAAVATLALGTGVILATASIDATTLVGPLPYPAGNRLVGIELTLPDYSGLPRPMSPVAYRRFRHEARALAESAFYARRGFNLELGGRSEYMSGVETTGSLFPTLGVHPLLGRIFGDRADQSGHQKVAVLSYRFWRAAFGGRPNVLDQNLFLNGTRYRVIGVMPRGFAFPDRRADFWVPYPFVPYDFRYFQLTAFQGHMIGRLASGASIQSLDTELRALTVKLVARFPAKDQANFFSHFSARAQSWRSVLIGHLETPLSLILLAALLLLALVWFNLANLFIARSTTRRGELLLREILGAGFRDRAWRFALEAGWITLCGVGVGYVLARGLLAALRALRLLPALTVLVGLGPGFTLLLLGLIGGCSMLVMTLVPVASGRIRDLGMALRESGARAGIARNTARTRRSLIMVQVALATCLTGLSLLLAHSLLNLTQVHPGFHTRHVVAFDVNLPSNVVSQPELWPTLHHLVAAVRATPGIGMTGVSSGLPFGVGGSDVNAVFRDPWVTRDDMHQAYVRVIDRHYLGVLGLDPLRGRLFTPVDQGSRAGVAVIDTLAARALFGHQNPIGRIFTFNSPNNTQPELRFRVVGLVATVRNKHLGRPPTTGSIYLDAPQALALSASTHTGWYAFSRWVFVVRSPLGIVPLKAALRATLHRATPWLAPYHFRTLKAHLDRKLRSRRVLFGLIGLFAVGALLLAAVGLFGVESYLVSQRIREFGIRLALGADRNRLVRLVWSEAGRMFAIGVAIGWIGIVFMGRLFASMLYGLGPLDPWSTALIVFLMGTVFLLAAWTPARRASRVLPAQALRRE